MVLLCGLVVILAMSDEIFVDVSMRYERIRWY